MGKVRIYRIYFLLSYTADNVSIDLDRLTVPTALLEDINTRFPYLVS